MTLKKILSKFLIWRIRHLSTKNFIIILGGLVGVLGGIAAVILKSSVHFIQAFIKHQEDPFLFVILPFFGIVITTLFAKYVLKEKLNHGITSILYVISKKSSIISRTKMYSRVLTSSITVGLGGSVGLEAPIVVTGSAIGSNIGRLMHLNYKQRTLMIGCGAAAAISGIFNSPVAGVIFSIEVILTDVTIAAFIPLLIAAVVGSLLSMLLLGDEVLFSFALADPFRTSDFGAYLLLGLACGLVSVYFTRLTLFTEDWFRKIHSDIYRAILGGLGLSFLIFLFRPLFGEGYDSIISLLNNRAKEIMASNELFNSFDNNWVIVLFGLAILLVKPMATGITIGSGGNGGIFAPSLFMGAVTGFLFAQIANLLTIGNGLSISNFTLIGMCGVMSGVLHAPLTAIFLIAEITGGYTLFLPLMLVSAIAFSSNSYFESHSFYTAKLIKAGDLIPYDKDRQVLSLINIEKMIEKDLLTIQPDQKLEDLVAHIKKSSRNLFPVVAADQTFQGIITLDDVREIMFNNESQKNIIVEELMHKPPVTVKSHESMEDVMAKFEKTGAWNLPVVNEGKYIGVVSKSRIFNAYRTKLRRQNKE